MSDYILADDLSGALEAGAAFTARGWRATLPFDDRAIEPAGPHGLCVISTESRNASTEDAAAAVRGALVGGRAAGARFLFKKIDSTLRGPIGAELLAVRQEIGPHPIVVCPANPAAGRTVRDGVLLLNGVPLAKTDFRDDPLWPARESRVAALLESQGVGPVASLGLAELRGGEAARMLRGRGDGKGAVIVADAETDADLDALVRMGGGRGTVFVGSGALAARVAAKQAGRGGTTNRPLPLPAIGSLLILCGSGHPVSLAQMDHLREAAGVEVLPFVADETDMLWAARTVVDAIEARRVAGVQFSSRAPRSPESARRLQECIARFAAALFDRKRPDGIFLTGGETARTVCGAIGGRSLEIIAEVEPGIILSRLQNENTGGPFVITKPGGYGSRNLAGFEPAKFLRGLGR